MRILYSAPDVAISGGHGGSAHIKGAIESFERLKHTITLIEKKNNLSSFANVLYCFFWPLVYTTYLCLFGKIDIVYERARIFSGGAILAGKLFGKKTILEYIEPCIELPILSGQIKQPFSTILRFHSKIINKCSDVITITHTSMTLGLPEEKCLLITTGADPERFQPKEDDGKTILYIGSFAPWHACENMIKAMQLVCEKKPKAKFIFVGEGEKLDACKKLVAELNLGQNVRFTNKIPQEQVPAIIKTATICLAVFDRNYLPFQKFDYYYSPIKVHEYKACGKPIIASNIGNLKELVKNNVNGLLVDESNINEISSAIIKLLRSKKLRDKIGSTNRKEVLETYNWGYVNTQILSRLIDKSAV
ncbi:MAG: glycosyltransferase family 4 protein [Nanoarchaeota archaeon]